MTYKYKVVRAVPELVFLVGVVPDHSANLAGGQEMSREGKGGDGGAVFVGFSNSDFGGAACVGDRGTVP
jgi:hypothetical protein